MVRSLFFLALLSASVSAAGTEETKLNGHTFQLPKGFTIQQVTDPTLVERPICADFDERGRLYVADSSGSSAPLEDQLVEKPHRIVRLEDTNGDGRYDRTVVFADRMMFPEGVMWYDGSVYVSAPPSIWKLTDTNDDGIADRREEWFQGKTLTHCGNDLHGPYLGLDGWFYWCKGAYAKQTYQRSGKEPFVTTASHIFRCRPDAPRDPESGSILTSAIEPVMTGGMANPVDVTFTPGGERIFSSTFLVRPGGGMRDGLIHAIYGGVYTDRRNSLDGHLRTGELMPILHHMGPAVPCGLTTYQSKVFGSQYQNNLFTCLFNMHKVTRQVLKPAGATFQVNDEDFLVSDNLDFHPTDVLEDADGSLLIIDTGGWYKICCPTSQLSKPDILGAIYRIRRTDSPRVKDPRGQSIQWSSQKAAQLTLLLKDPRPAVQQRAIAELRKKGGAAVESLQSVVSHSKHSLARRNAVWALTRIDNSQARSAVRIALNDSEETIRQAALHSISLWRDAEAVDQLIEILKIRSAGNQRAAAEALGRIGDFRAVRALLAAAGNQRDRVLEHSLIYALIEIGDPRSTSAGLTAANVRTRRAAMIALDQMPQGKLQPKTVIPLLTAKDPLLKETASWIIEHRPGWSDSLLGYFQHQLSNSALSPKDRRSLEGRIASFGHNQSVQQLLASSLSSRQLSDVARVSVLRAMSQSGLKELPLAWVSAITLELSRKNPNLLGEAIQVARKMRLPKQGGEELIAALRQVGQSEQRSADLRLQALAAIETRLKKIDATLFQFLMRHLNPELPVSSRAAATEVLVKAALNDSQRIALANGLIDVSPLNIVNLLKSFQRSSNEQVGLALADALQKSIARAALRIETLKPIFSKYPASVQQQAEKLYQAIKADKAEQFARLEHLLATLPQGNVRRGQEVFRSTKAACYACHSIGYMGGKTGPDLTRIARVRNRRDLLEAIVFPSASLVQSYEPIVLATLDGKVYNGLVRSETADSLVLTTGPNQEVRIPRDEIDEIQPSKISIMPAGLDKQLSPQQLADLIEFLENTK